MEVEAINRADANVGDRVMIGFETASLLKVSFLLYVFPILCMILGAVFGQKIATFFSLNPTALSVVGGFLFFFLAFRFIKQKGNQLAKQNRYRPKVIRILAAP
jgi:sigma-E factor negative regulatory protein RseC